MVDRAVAPRQTEDAPKVAIYTDGACNPNPGPGGWAAVLLFPGREPEEMSGSEPDTTNNRMELRAALEALKSLPGPHCVEMHTDSTYLKRGINEWLPLWRGRNWQTGGGEPVKNVDLWQELSRQIERHDVSWRWLRGHSGDRWNERADRLATANIPRPGLPLDDGSAVHVFTGASCRGQVGPGGWGVVLRYGDREVELSGASPKTTGNRMHIQAALEGLHALKGACKVHLYTTSDYLQKGFTIWVEGWQKNGWRTKEGAQVKNSDLWQALLEAATPHAVECHLVRDEPPDRLLRANRLARTGW